MTINNSIKSIIIDGTKLLVAKMRDENGNEYYTLPGGKQRPNELMLDALIRETREETGYTVQPKQLLFIREGFKGEKHRIEFMFVCDIVGAKDETLLHYDNNQIGSEWISIDNITHEELHPVEMRNIIKRHFLGKSNEIYLGEME